MGDPSERREQACPAAGSAPRTADAATTATDPAGNGNLGRGRRKLSAACWTSRLFSRHALWLHSILEPNNLHDDDRPWQSVRIDVQGPDDPSGVHNETVT